MIATYERASANTRLSMMTSPTMRFRVSADNNQTKLNEIASQAKLNHGLKIMKNGRLSIEFTDLLNLIAHLESNGIQVVAK